MSVDDVGEMVNFVVSEKWWSRRDGTLAVADNNLKCTVTS